ncbi:hypothetical protein ORI20_15560 [Mycobacterium sp. CVI_P3]|uniref:DUF4062 domain-containing protein n=1 Tax=Mycobacterium pinniadriaticum TaxID=2994102 RepID=A0ABT3SH76_9MYCO|nr:hypothetical protein [Mycobacterium pinniadriaticum]MCX2931698.1 hypothetical protein [Mycobacterium pinniadriaticum]MCX2938227.1 hypothetical protein [Mycobacterium pinniadriaticum]
MGFDAHVLKVLIASPSDTIRERDAIEKAHGWNSSRAEREQIQLAPWRWETHAIPELGGTAQDIIDRQAVETCDVVIAVFNARLGTATDDAVSGTAHEIIHAHGAGKPVHVYFSTEPFPRDTKPEEIQRLNDFKDQLRGEGLLGEYASVEDLQFKVRDAIERDLASMDLGKVVIRSNKADQARKIMSYRTSVSIVGQDVWRVQVFNHSTGPISRLNVNVSAVDANGSPIDGVRRSKDVISMDEVFSRIIGDGLAGGFGRIIGQGPARMLGNAVASQARPALNDALIGHVADGFPSGLAPNQSAVVLYVLPPAATPVVVVEFNDETGVSWSRANDEDPQRLSSSAWECTASASAATRAPAGTYTGAAGPSTRPIWVRES